ncbi:MAG: hypothetical protein O3B76_04865 [Proteobacteria bacterium]|nr:hypothetical protein [Pseudomonadota bacterium]
MKSFSVFAIVVGLLGFMLFVSYSPDKKTPGEMKQMAIMSPPKAAAAKVPVEGKKRP